MAEGDRVRWDSRHTLLTGAARPAPPDALREREGLVPRAGRALEVACGRGAVALWLHEQGLAVDAVDVSPVAVEAGRAADPGVRWHVHDLDAGLPAECTGPYDVVVCQRFRDPALYPALRGALAPGGLLAITVLSQVDDVHGPFRAAPGELLAAFGDLTVLEHTERGGLASFLGRA